MARTISVMLCCNDPDNGNFTGKLSAVQFGDELMSLEVNVIGAEPGLKWDGRYIKVSRTKFRVTASGRWVGNWCWDSVEMTVADAARLANYLRSLRYKSYPIFHCDAARTDLFEKWETTEPFTPADFRPMVYA